MDATQRALGEHVLGHLTRHPEQHDQATYGDRTQACGTTACVVGWTVMLATPQQVIGVEWVFVSWMSRTMMREVAMPDGRFISPGEAAQELLGITDEEAETLFHESTDNDEACDYLNTLLADHDKENPA